MKVYTDGFLIIKVGWKYAHVFNKAGSELDRADVRDGSFMEYMEREGFKEVE